LQIVVVHNGKALDAEAEAAVRFADLRPRCMFAPFTALLSVLSVLA
jgi:hypothetical protein